MGDPRTDHRILYDADCGFCRWSLAWILRWDRRRRLYPVPIQEPEGERLLPEMSEDQRLASWHLVTPAGEVLSAGRALPPLLRLLPGGAPLAAVLGRFPRLIERAYAWVARNRRVLAKPLGERSATRSDAVIGRRRAGSA